jgi:hypothetical protein
VAVPLKFVAESHKWLDVAAAANHLNDDIQLDRELLRIVIRVQVRLRGTLGLSGFWCQRLEA